MVAWLQTQSRLSSESNILRIGLYICPQSKNTVSTLPAHDKRKLLILLEYCPILPFVMGGQCRYCVFTLGGRYVSELVSLQKPLKSSQKVKGVTPGKQENNLSAVTNGGVQQSYVINWKEVWVLTTESAQGACHIKEAICICTDLKTMNRDEEPHQLNHISQFSVCCPLVTILEVDRDYNQHHYSVDGTRQTKTVRLW